MQTRVEGRAWKYGDNVNTDVIFPGKYTYTLRDPKEMAAHALEDLDPSFAIQVSPGDLIVAGRNWGCGSSREQAVTSLQAAGVHALVAASFARIYYRNALNAGLPAIICPAAVEAIVPDEIIAVDLQGSTIHCAGGSFPFEPFPPFLLAMIEAGGLIPYLQQTLRQDHA